MWQCMKCRQEVEDNFDVCWNCGTSRDGTEDPDFRKADEIPAASLSGVAAAPLSAQARQPEKNPIFCPRCNRKLDYVGTKQFHEGSVAWSLLGELFVNREHFDVYLCPRCGRVEFFIDGVGEEYRPH